MLYWQEAGSRIIGKYLTPIFFEASLKPTAYLDHPTAHLDQPSAGLWRGLKGLAQDKVFCLTLSENCTSDDSMDAGFNVAFWRA